MAKDSVTVGNNPSGTLATIMPIAKIKFVQKGKPIHNPIRKNATPINTDSIAINRLNRTISSCSGDNAASVTWVKCAILPNSLCMPVA